VFGSFARQIKQFLAPRSPDAQLSSYRHNLASYASRHSHSLPLSIGGTKGHSRENAGFDGITLTQRNARGIASPLVFP
jgi:hypothetical protein